MCYVQAPAGSKKTAWTGPTEIPAEQGPKLDWFKTTTEVVGMALFQVLTYFWALLQGSSSILSSSIVVEYDSLYLIVFLIVFVQIRSTFIVLYLNRSCLTQEF